MNEKFWLNDLSVIYKNYSFKISKNMSINQVFNTLTRIIIIIFIILTFYFNDLSILLIMLIILLVIIVIYYTLQYVNIQDISKENFANQEHYNNNNTVINDKMDNDISSLGSDFSSIMTVTDGYSNLISDNVHSFNADTDSLNNNINLNNINKLREDMFNTMDENFEKKNMERTFQTQQNYNIPSGQGEAMKWIHATPVTCKEYTGVCKQYDDLSMKRNPIY
ncbi:hypothetical protein Hokovirus_2_95 [Hokovirus HKV1]|uniref:Minor capsid protein P9 transmembrane helices domain-containing protein n=1 Tax=Hokovirus HKV1 TaxID=1977638 RepID=A0A1V0SG13_9VIRU|nr:hypothetical protein Hokovirus_2_95 [Hokovirus HKV1]